MSTTIDQKVVEMRFDNKQFESGVQTSLSTLNDLKQGLNFTGATKGLENISSAAKNVNLSPISQGVDVVISKFSHLQMTVQHQLNKIVDHALASGKKMVDALTVDPVKMGFQEYETQINSVQTILANTESKGTTLNDVNSALDELNTYADKTIYNFTEMTRNIGTFTAAGVDLDTSVNAIQGIANLAAVSGSTSQQASTAMYQLSQALASGTVKLMDWNSVVNAGMGGEVFQNALKETARVHGVAIDSMIEEEGSFRETLKDGWLTSEILTETLQKFTLTTEGLTEEQIKANREMLKAKGYTEKQIDEIFKLGNTATNAATKVKTFTQLFDTLKEAAQSGWTQTWETIIGDFEEAKELMTDISDTVGKFINASSKRRNDLLSGALDTNWEKLIKKINEAGIETEDFEAKVKSVAKDQGVDIDALIEKYGSLEKAFRSGAISSDILNQALGKISKTTADLSKITGELKKGSKGDDVKELQKALKDLDFDIGKSGVDGILGKKTEEAIKAFQEANSLEVTGIVDEKTLAALEKATSDMNNLSEACKGLISNITELGGREILIESLKNIFKTLLDIVKPIKQAFEEIFPPITSEQLLNFIKGFKELTDKFKIGATTAENIKRTFKGVFAVFSIGVQAIKALFGGLATLIGYIAPAGDGILGFTAKIGDFLVGLNEGIKSTNFFGKIMETIGLVIQRIVGLGEILQPIGESISNVVGKIADKIAELFNIDLSGLDIFKDKAEASFSPFEKLGGIIGTAFGGIASILSKVLPVISKLGSIAADAFGKIGGIVSELISNFDIETAATALNTGLFASILFGIKNFIDTLTSATNEGKGIFGSMKGIFGKISGILDGVKGSLEAYQSDLKSNVLLKIAAAIAILAAAIIALSFIDTAKMTTALTGITVLFAELFTTISQFTKMTGGKGFAKLAIVAAAMIGLSVAVLILSAAVTVLSRLNWGELAKGLVGVGAILGGLTLFSKFAELGGMKLGKGLGLMALAASVVILATAVKKLSSLNPEELIKGLVAVGVILAELALFTNFSGSPKRMISTGTGMVILGAAMLIFAEAVKRMSTLSWTEIGRGLLTMAGALVAVTLAVNFMPKGMIGKATGMVILGAAMLIFAEAVKRMGNLSWEEIGRGLFTMAVALAAITAAMYFMPPTMILSAIGMVAVGAALLIIGQAIKSMGGMTWGEIAKGLVTLAGSMLILIVGLNGMLLALPGALAMVVVSGALAVLAGVLKVFAGMSLAEIGKSLLVLAGAFAVIGLAGYLLAPLAPSLLLLGAAIALIGVGCMAAGVGLLLFSAGLSALAVSGTAGAAALVVIFTSLASLIPMYFTQIGNGILALCNVIIAGAPAICEAVVVVVTSLVSALIECIPLVVDGVFQLLTALLTSLAEYLPTIVQAGFDILLAILQGIRDNIGQILTVAGEIIVEFLNGIAGMLGDIIQAGFNLLLSFINGITQSIETNTPLLIEAMNGLILALLDAALLVLSNGPKLFKEAGNKIMNSGLVQGIKEKLGDLKEAVGDLISKAKEKITENITEWWKKGRELIAKIIDGIKTKVGDVKTSISTMISDAKGKITEKLSEWTSAGKDMIAGFISGIKEKASDAVDAAKGVVSDALEGAKKLLGIASPSKEFAKVGKYSDEGLVVGFKKYAGKVVNAAKSVSGGALDAMSKGFANMSNMIGLDIDSQPTIRPVMDLSDVENGTSAINSMLSMGSSIGVSANVGAVSSMMSRRIQNGGNSDIIAALDKLDKHLDNVGNTSYNVNGVTYDDGSNVREAIETIVRAARIERRT